MVKFSVIIPLYNKSATVERSVNSVLRQSCTDFEIVVVDDGSTDGGAGVVKGIADNRVRLVGQANGGVSAARNKGIEMAQGEFITFLDADDEYAPGHLSALNRLTEMYPGHNVYGTTYLIRSGGTDTFPTIKGAKFCQSRADGEGVLESFFRVMAACHAPVHIGSIAVRRDSLGNIRFPVGVKAGEDLYFMTRLMTENKMVLTLTPSYIYNFEDRNRVMRKHEEIDALFDGLLHLPCKDPYLRSYIALWHTRRAIYALRAKNFSTIFYHLMRSIAIKPAQTKVYTAMAMALFRLQQQPQPQQEHL